MTETKHIRATVAVSYVAQVDADVSADSLVVTMAAPLRSLDAVTMDQGPPEGEDRMAIASHLLLHLLTVARDQMSMQCRKWAMPNPAMTAIPPPPTDAGPN